MTETLVQGLASGSWDMTFAGVADPPRTISGPLDGTSYTAAVYFGSGDTAGGCPLQFTGLLTPVRLAGAYVSLPNSGCANRSGTVDLTKQ